MRRRIIRPNTRSFVGRHVCSQTGQVVRFESSLERDAVTLFRSRQPTSIIEQPFTVTFFDRNGQRRRYTPDFSVTYSDGRVIVYEVKFRSQLRARWPEYREVLVYMRQHLAGNARFRFLTELTIRTPRLENLRLLSPHRRSLPHPRFAAPILEAAARSPLTIADAIGRLCSAPGDRAYFYAALWPLVANGKLAVDLSKPLGMHTILEVVDGQ